MSAIREGDRQGQVSMDNDSQSINLKRRRLVKGLAGATPGIFTLYSGNAAALASATQRCILNDRVRFDGSAVRISDDFFTDEWQRGSLSEPAIQVKNGSETRWLASVRDTETNNLHWYEVEIDGTGGATWNDFNLEWKQCADSGNNRTFQEPQTLPVCNATEQGPWAEHGNETVEAHSLFCVNDEGDVVSAYPEDCLDYRPVNRSCWASIDPGAPDPTDRGDWWK